MGIYYDDYLTHLYQKVQECCLYEQDEDKTKRELKELSVVLLFLLLGVKINALCIFIQDDDASSSEFSFTHIQFIAKLTHLYNKMVKSEQYVKMTKISCRFHVCLNFFPPFV